MVDPALTTEALAHLLTMSGLEVEAIDPVAPAFSRVVVGRVLAVERHPNADKLTVCKVDAGQGSPLAIVCGAPNVAAGMKVPCALVGAKLPGISIKRAAVRGVESNGMLCSARELGLSDDHSGLLALPADAPVGRDVREILELEDRVLTIKLTPNRADCLSVLGVAREVAALTGTKLTPPDTTAIPGEERREIPGEDLRSVRLRPLRGSRDPQRERRRADPGLDEAPPRARRPALDLRAGGRHELRDARAGPPAARLRPRQAAGRHRRPLRTRRREREAPQRADRRGRPGRARDHGCERSDRPRRHHGRRQHEGGSRHATRVPRVRVLLPRGDRRPRAALQLRERCLAPVRARRRFRQRGAGDRARDRADPRDLRRRARADRGHGGEAARAQARPDARRARAAGHRHPRPGRRDGRDLPAARPRGNAVRARGRRGVRRHAAVVPLRHRDRGRPDRGGRARPRVRSHPRASAGRSGGHARRARGAAVAARPARGSSPPRTTRRSSTSASSTTPGSAISRATRTPFAS